MTTAHGSWLDECDTGDDPDELIMEQLDHLI